jgi:hypothetical protein
MNAELLMQVQALDPAPPDAELPTGMASADVVLAAIDERNRTVQTRERVDVKRPEPQRRWAPALVAAAAFVVVLAVGVVIWLIGSGSDDDVVEPTTTTTTQATTTTTEVPTTEATPEPGTFVADATLINSRADLAPGTYGFVTVGTPFSLTVELPDGLSVMELGRAFIAMGPPTSRQPSDKDIVVMRLPALSDPTAPNASIQDQGEGWPADDFSGWLDNLNEGIVVTDRQETTLGGLDAIRVDLDIADIECFAGGGYCALFASNPPAGVANAFGETWAKGLNSGAKYRIWVVDQGSEAPLAIIVGILREADRSWMDALTDVVSTIGFGDIAPNPNDG